MPKIGDRPLSHIHLRIYTDQKQRLEQRTTPEVGFNMLVRAIIESWLRHAEAKERAAIDALAPAQLDLDITKLMEKQQ